MEKLNEMDENYYLWMLLNQTNTAIHRARRKELSKYKLTPTQAGILHAVTNLGNKATPAEISRWVFLEPQSVSEMISKMEIDGIITKSQKKSNKNMIIVKLTEKGNTLMEKSNRRKSINTIISSLSRRQKKQLWLYLLTLREKALKTHSLERKVVFKYKDAIK